MGLLLSILVFSVGVLEALACVRHIQQGILPAWAPRHVATPSGRRLLRDRWRKSTSRDEGGEVPAEVTGESPSVPSMRVRPPPLQLDRASSPALHRARTPDIHWPEPVPHSPAKSVEQTLPSPVEEVPGDTSTTEAPWPAAGVSIDTSLGTFAVAPTSDVLAGRRRTSVTETIPPMEQAHPEPLEAPAPAPEFAREIQEPRRCKPAKSSSFEEASIEPAFQPPSPVFPEVSARQPEVISLSFEDYSAAGPRAAVVGRIQITATKEGTDDDEPSPWPIVNIDTLAPSDEEGDVTPPANDGTRRVSFDPTPIVVSFDKEKPVSAEELPSRLSTVTPPVLPKVWVTHELEDLLRKQLPAFVDQIFQEAVIKATDALAVRGRGGAISGISLILEDIASKGEQALRENTGNESVEEYKDRFEARKEGSTEEVVSSFGDNIYRLIDKLQRGEELGDVSDNDLKLSIKKYSVETDNIEESLKHGLRNGNSLPQPIMLPDAKDQETFHHEEFAQIDDGHINPSSDNLNIHLQSSEEELQMEQNFENIYESETNDSAPINQIEDKPYSAYSPDKKTIQLEDVSEPELITQEIILDEIIFDKNEDVSIYSDERTTNLIVDAAENTETSSDDVWRYDELQENIISSERYPVETVRPYENEEPSDITQEMLSSFEDAISPPTPPSAVEARETLSAPLTTNNGPEEAKEARTLAKQVSPGPQGPLDEAQNTRSAAFAAAADFTETDISSGESQAFDIEPGPPVSPDVRSSPQQSAELALEGLKRAASEEPVFPEGRPQDPPRATPPPPSPPLPDLAPAPTTTEVQEQATDSTPSAGKNESSRNKDKKKKQHPYLRKRNSKEKRSRRVQTPQASPSPSEDEEEVPERAAVIITAAPAPSPTPFAREPSPPTPTPVTRHVAAEPEVSARETPSATSSFTGSSSGGVAAARPATPAARQSEAFWVSDSQPLLPTSVSFSATPFGPSVKKPYRRKPREEEDMPVFTPKATRFEWPPKPREERPVRPRSAAFSLAASADPKEHFPPAPPLVPELPPEPEVPEPPPEETLISATSPIPDTPNAASPIPTDVTTEQLAANDAAISDGTTPNGTTPNDTATEAEDEAAREAAASPVPGRFKFDVEMPSTRPMTPPAIRDPKEVVKKLSNLKKSNPGVASEVLMSILGFHCPH